MKVISLLKVLGKEANLVFSSWNDMFTQMQMWVYSICNSFVKWKLEADSSFLCPSWSWLKWDSAINFHFRGRKLYQMTGETSRQATILSSRSSAGGWKAVDWPQNSTSRYYMQAFPLQSRENRSLRTWWMDKLSKARVSRGSWEMGYHWAVSLRAF